MDHFRRMPEPVRSSHIPIGIAMPTAPPPEQVPRMERLRTLAVPDNAPEPLFEGIARIASLVAGRPIALADLTAHRLPAHLTTEQIAILAELTRVAELAAEQRAVALERNAALAREITTERDLRRGAQEWQDRLRGALASLEASERRFRQLFQFSLGLICTHDLDGILLSVNPAAAKSLGYPLNELMGRPLSDFIRPERMPSYEQYLQRIAAVGSDSGRLELRSADGELRIWAYHNVLDDDGEERYVLGHAQDVTDQHRQERQLREWSLSDPLTQCYNRRYLAHLGESCRDESLGCIAVDLDRFKAVNDTYGHQHGDDVLVGIAQFLRKRVRHGDAVIRLGGDEFLIILRDADAAQLASLETRLHNDAVLAPIAFTLGAALKPRGGALANALEAADRRLYEARAERADQLPFHAH